MSCVAPFQWGRNGGLGRNGGAPRRQALAMGTEWSGHASLHAAPPHPITAQERQAYLHMGMISKVVHGAVGVIQGGCRFTYESNGCVHEERGLHAMPRLICRVIRT